MPKNSFLATALVSAAALWVFASAAHADTIQDSYGPFSVDFLSGAEVTGALQGFDPALGTLSGIGFTYSSSAVLFEGNAISSTIKIDDSSGTLLQTISFGNMTGRAEGTASGSFTVPLADFADFENVGNIDLSLTPFTACRGSAPTPSGCDNFHGSVSGEVTYTYTPVSTPVPEPASLAIFGAALAGLGLMRRRRMAHL